MLLKENLSAIISFVTVIFVAHFSIGILNITNSTHTIYIGLMFFVLLVMYALLIEVFIFIYNKVVNYLFKKV